MKKNEKDVLVKIDEQTLKRYDSLYVDGDYSRIAALSTYPLSNIIRSLKVTKVAALSLAKVMKTFYQKKGTNGGRVELLKPNCYS
jgi:hypothetical protein